MVIRTALLICLTGCGLQDAPRAAAVPIVRGTDGGFASVTIIACPPNDFRAQAAAELVQLLTQHDEMVIARAGGTARLLINACPGGVPVSAPTAVRRH